MAANRHLVGSLFCLLLLHQSCAREETKAQAVIHRVFKHHVCIGRFCTASEVIRGTTLRAVDCLKHAQSESNAFLSSSKPFGVRVKLSPLDFAAWGLVGSGRPPGPEERIALHDLAQLYHPREGCEAIIIRTPEGKTSVFAHDAASLADADWLSSATRLGAEEEGNQKFLTYWGEPEDDVGSGRVWFFIYAKNPVDEFSAKALAERMGLEIAHERWCLVISNDPIFGGVGEFPWLNPLLVQFATRRFLELGNHAPKRYLYCAYEPGKGFRCRSGSDPYTLVNQIDLR